MSARDGIASPSPSCSWTWTTSRPSTTPSVIGVGDQLLQALAEVCRTALRTSDVLGRVGGEEFAVILPETGLEDALEVADRLREVVESLRVTADSDTS